MHVTLNVCVCTQGISCVVVHLEEGCHVGQHEWLSSRLGETERYEVVHVAALQGDGAGGKATKCTRDKPSLHLTCVQMYMYNACAINIHNSAITCSI